jgi:hypothetical protein
MSAEHPAGGARHRHGHRRSHGWVVILEVAGNTGGEDFEDRMLELADLLQPYGGLVSLERDRSRYRATFSLGEPELGVASAMSVGCHLFRDLAARAGLPTWPIVHAEITQVGDHADLRIVR